MCQTMHLTFVSVFPTAATSSFVDKQSPSMYRNALPSTAKRSLNVVHKYYTPSAGFLDHLAKTPNTLSSSETEKGSKSKSYSDNFFPTRKTEQSKSDVMKSIEMKQARKPGYLDTFTVTTDSPRTKSYLDQVLTNPSNRGSGTGYLSKLESIVNAGKGGYLWFMTSMKRKNSTERTDSD